MKVRMIGAPLIGVLGMTFAAARRIRGAQVHRAGQVQARTLLKDCNPTNSGFACPPARSRACPARAVTHWWVRARRPS